MSEGTTGTRRWIAYDGDCPVCIAMVGVLVRLGLARRDDLRTYTSFERETSMALWNAGIRNELCVLDEPTGEIRTGARGLLWAMEATWLRPLASVLSSPLLLPVSNVAYRTIAFNRGVIVPRIQRDLSCECDPDFHRGYRTLWILAAFGAACAALHLFESASVSDFPLLLGFALANASLAGASVGLGEREGIDWLGHCATTNLVGAAVLLVPTLGGLVFGRELPTSLTLEACIVALLLMLWIQLHRNRAAGRPMQTVFWSLSIAFGMGVASFA